MSLLPVLLGAGAHVSKRLAELRAGHARLGGELAQRPRVMTVRGPPRSGPALEQRPAHVGHVHAQLVRESLRELMRWARRPVHQLVERRRHLGRTHVQSVGESVAAKRASCFSWILSNAAVTLSVGDPERLGQRGGKVPAPVACLVWWKSRNASSSLSASTPSVSARFWKPGGGPPLTKPADRRYGLALPLLSPRATAVPSSACVPRP